MSAHALQSLLQERYRIVSLLGRGGQSHVYIAADEAQGGRKVVVKSIIYHSTDPAMRHEELSLFLQEPEILEASSHVALPRYVDAFETERGHCFVVELCGNRNLEQVVQERKGPLTLAEVTWVGLKMLGLLTYLHERPEPVVLRDIKPSNITCATGDRGRILQPQGLWFIDLTIAMPYAPGVQDKVRMGSPGYSPPEQYRGTSEPRSDLYALTATLFHLLTQHDPASTPFAVPSLLRFRADLGADWEAFFSRGLALEPAHRFGSAREMEAELRRLSVLPVGLLADEASLGRLFLLLALMLLLMYMLVAGIGFGG